MPHHSASIWFEIFSSTFLSGNWVQSALSLLSSMLVGLLKSPWKAAVLLLGLDQSAELSTKAPSWHRPNYSPPPRSESDRTKRPSFHLRSTVRVVSQALTTSCRLRQCNKVVHINTHRRTTQNKITLYIYIHHRMF